MYLPNISCDLMPTSSTTSTPIKRERSTNNYYFEVWTTAFETFNLHYKNYHDRQETKEFWNLVASQTGYGDGASSQTAANNNIRKWVESYVADTGPSNTGAEAFNYHQITKQHKRTQAESMELVQSYAPFFGTRKRFRQQENAKPAKNPPLKEHVQEVGIQHKRYNDLMEDNNVFESKNVEYIDVV